MKVDALPFRDYVKTKLGVEGPFGDLALFVTTDPRAVQLDGAPLRNYLVSDCVEVADNFIWQLWNELTVIEAEKVNKGLTIAETEITTAASVELPDMPATVLSGTLGKLCRERLSRFPIGYAWPALLAATAPYVRPRTGTGTQTNLYVALVGEVHSGKSRAIEDAIHLVSASPIDLKAGSAEGLLAFLEPYSGEGALWTPDELSHLLDKAAISNASFAANLSTLFYKPKGALTIFKGKVIEYDVRLSLLAGIVDSKFSEGFGTSTTIGLYDRFLFGQCPTGFRYRYRPFEGNPAYTPPPTTKRTSPLLGPFVAENVRREMDRLRDAENFNPRVMEIALRTALVSAAFDRIEKLDTGHLFDKYLEPAWELARYQERVRKLLQPNEGKTFDGQIAHKILAYLNAHAPDGKWIVLRDVLRSTKVNNFGPPAVERVIRGLEFSEDVEVVRQKAPGQKTGFGRQLIRLANLGEISTGGEVGTVSASK